MWRTLCDLSIALWRIFRWMLSMQWRERQLTAEEQQQRRTAADLLAKQLDRELGEKLKHISSLTERQKLEELRRRLGVDRHKY